MVVPFVYTEEEYKKLEEEYDNFKKKVSDDMKEIAKYQLENIGLFDKLEQENKKLKEERDFFKEQAILWRKDYKNEYEKNKKLEEESECYKKQYEHTMGED